MNRSSVTSCIRIIPNFFKNINGFVFFSGFDDSDADPTFQPNEEDELDDDISEHLDVKDIKEDLEDMSPVEDMTEETGRVSEHVNGTPTSSGPKITVQDRWKKKNFCPFCGAAQSQFARHVLKKHKDNLEVKRASAFPVGSKERRQIFEKLVHDGNFKHNSNVIRQGEGTLIPGRCPPKKMKATRTYLLPCGKCKGFFSKKNLYRKVMK